MGSQEEQIENKGIEPIDLTIMIGDFVRMLKKKFISLVLLVAVCAAGFTVYQHFTYVPQFTAYQTYTVSTSKDATMGGNYYDTSTAQQFAKTFPYIITSDVMQRKVARALGTDAVQGNIQASVMENTNFLTISVTDTDAKRAYDALQVVLQVYPEISESIIGKIYLELMDESGLPSEPDNPNSLKLNLIKGAGIGIILGIIWILILLITNKTIRCQEDCQKRLNSKCIGGVPRVIEKARSKKMEYHPSIIAKNIDEEFMESFRIIRNKIVHLSQKNGIKTILITSALPGEGKSTIAVNTALALTQENKKVALIDCDLRNPSDGAIINAPEGKGLIDFLKGGAKFSECVLQSKDLFEFKLPFLFVRGGKPVSDGASYLASDKMRKLVEVLQRQVDYVIIDSAPAGLMTDAGILAQYSQGAIFVVKKDFAKDSKIMEGMEHVSDSNVDIIGCILNGENQ